MSEPVANEDDEVHFVRNRLTIATSYAYFFVPYPNMINKTNPCPKHTKDDNEDDKVHFSKWAPNFNRDRWRPDFILKMRVMDQ